MNLLSHALLSRHEPSDVFTVNVLWDFLGRDLRQDRRDFVRRGAKIHRVIDRETDQSDEFKEALGLVPSSRELGSSVIVDIALDYALSQDWSYYSSEDRLLLIERFYDRMERAAPKVSPQAVVFVERMRERNWFKAYGELDGIQRVFERLANRHRFLQAIIGAEAEVERRLDQYCELMRSLYPKVKLAVREL